MRYSCSYQPKIDLPQFEIPWRARVSSKAMELQAAMEILAEVFGTRPGEVEEMIQRRLEERSWAEEDGRWPQKFWVEG